jgi:hypothetical protein
MTSDTVDTTTTLPTTTTTESPTTTTTTTSPAVPAGVVADMQGVVEIEQPDGTWTQAGARTVVNLGDHIRTGADGKLQILMLDETIFTIGPNSNMVIDTFVYDPTTSDQTTAADILKGTFRFVTSKLVHDDPARVKIKLPVAAIGIRGCDMIFSINPTTKTETIDVHEGTAEFLSPRTVKSRQVTAGHQATITVRGKLTTRVLTPAEWAGATQSVSPITQGAAGANYSAASAIVNAAIATFNTLGSSWNASTTAAQYAADSQPVIAAFHTYNATLAKDAWPTNTSADITALIAGDSSMVAQLNALTTTGANQATAWRTTWTNDVTATSAAAKRVRSDLGLASSTGFF